MFLCFCEKSFRGSSFAAATRQVRANPEPQPRLLSREVASRQLDDVINCALVVVVSPNTSPPPQGHYLKKHPDADTQNGAPSQYFQPVSSTVPTPLPVPRSNREDRPCGVVVEPVGVLKRCERWPLLGDKQHTKAYSERSGNASRGQTPKTKGIPLLKLSTGRIECLL